MLVRTDRRGRVARRTEALKPHARPTQRDAHVVAAAVARAATERHQRPQRGEIAGGVVAGRHRHTLRAIRCSLAGSESGDGLRELLPARSGRPGAAVTVAVDRDVNDAWPQRSELRRAEPPPLQCAGAEALREHVALANKPLELV